MDNNYDNVNNSSIGIINIFKENKLLFSGFIARHISFHQDYTERTISTLNSAQMQGGINSWRGFWAQIMCKLYIQIMSDALDEFTFLNTSSFVFSEMYA